MMKEERRPRVARILGALGIGRAAWYRKSTPEEDKKPPGPPPKPIPPAAEVIAGLRKSKAEAERIHGPLKERPFLVTDNGSSFLAKRFCAFIVDGWSHVRIRYRTPQQLGLLERFHRTLKNEEVYWRLYDRPAHARECLAEFHIRYNTKRPHWALVPETGGDPVTPEEVYRGGVAIVTLTGGVGGTGLGSCSHATKASETARASATASNGRFEDMTVSLRSGPEYNASMPGTGVGFEKSREIVGACPAPGRVRSGVRSAHVEPLDGRRQPAPDA